MKESENTPRPPRQVHRPLRCPQLSPRKGRTARRGEEGFGGRAVDQSPTSHWADDLEELRKLV